MQTIPVYLSVPPSVFRVGLVRVLEQAAPLRPVVWEGGEAAAPSAAVLDADDVEGGLVGLERAGLLPNRVLAVRTVRGTAEAAELLALNVAGVTSAADAPEALVEKVRAAAEGDWRRSRRDLFDLLERARRDEPAPLGPRDAETLRLVAGGLSNRRIAERLHLAEGTARNRVSALYARIGVRTRAEAILWAWRSGLAPERDV